MGGGDVMLDSCSSVHVGLQRRACLGCFKITRSCHQKPSSPYSIKCGGCAGGSESRTASVRNSSFISTPRRNGTWCSKTPRGLSMACFLMLKPLDFNEKGNLELIDLDLEEIKIERTPIWVQIHGLPLELLMNDDVQTVGEMLGAAAGEVVKVAPNGRYMKFYVRVQVMIDPEVPVVAGHFLKLPPWVVQRRPMWVEFGYERVFKLCYICGRIGHKKQSCDLTLEEAERVVFERVDEVGRRLGCGVATDYSRRLYTGRVRAHHRGLTWGSRRWSNRVIFFDEEDGMPPVNPADFDDDEDPSLTIYMMRKRVGGGGKVVFERVDIDIEDTYWVKESRSYWRDIGVRR